MKHISNSSRTRFMAAGLLLAAMSVPSAMHAVPAYPGVIQAEQPDGTTLPVVLKGDERGHRVFTTDGYQLLRDAKGFFSYATVDAAGMPVASVMRASEPHLRSGNEKAFLSTLQQPLVTRAFEQQERMMAATRSGGENQRYLCSGAAFPASGSPRALVILVEYQDVAFSMDDPQDFYTRLLNEEGFNDYNATGSVRDYFVENSYGIFTPQFDLYGPVKLMYDRSHYGANLMGQMGMDVAPEEMVIEACLALDDDVDFSVYDTNNDGQIDNVFIFYAGYGEADSGQVNTVWPHSADMVDFGLGKDYIFDGKLLNRYGCTNEIDYTYRRPDGIGTFVHEFSHVMGLPDLYATGYTEVFSPDAYSVLDMGPYNNNGRTPPHYSSFERYCLDWLEPEVLEYNGDYQLRPLHKSNQAYLLQTEKENEFYMLENRQQECCDEFIPGHGMLVWHIDYLKPIWDRNVVNNTASHQYVDLVEANNRRVSSERPGTPFPGKSNVTEFGEMTSPELRSWDGEKLAVTRIYDIREEEGNIFFSVKGKDPAINAVDEISASPAAFTIEGNQVFNNGTAVAAVYDLAGRKVAEINPASQTTLAPGIYLLAAPGQTLKIKI